jgi:hypothetical protein
MTDDGGRAVAAELRWWKGDNGGGGDLGQAGRKWGCGALWGVGARGRNFGHSSGEPPYIHRLTDECITTYIRWSGLRSLVPGFFLGLGTEEYSSVIFIGTEEYKKVRKIPVFL